MATYPTRVIDTTRCGTDVLSVRFERPQGYEFRSGQWFRLTLPTEEGPQARTFSHATAPGDQWLEVTTRLSPSSFKKTLASLVPGSEAEVGPSGGRLSLPTDDKVVFLIGGVGVTPARSLLRDAEQTGRQFGDALVVYGNRDDTCEPYLDELIGLEHIGVRVVRVLERPGPGWEGESGMITADLMTRYVDPEDGRVFIVTGPPAMIVAMTSVLDQLGVSRERRLVESFGTLETSHA